MRRKSHPHGPSQNVIKQNMHISANSCEVHAQAELNALGAGSLIYLSTTALVWLSWCCRPLMRGQEGQLLLAALSIGAIYAAVALWDWATPVNLHIIERREWRREDCLGQVNLTFDPPP